MVGELVDIMQGIWGYRGRRRERQEGEGQFGAEQCVGYTSEDAVRIATVMTSLLRAIRARPVPHFTCLPPRRFYSESVRRCPQCQAPLPTPLPVCNQCSFIQASPSKIPYHTLFQLPFEPNPFVVSSPDLKRRYLEAQKLCHPDGWASQGEVRSFIYPLS